MLTVIFYFNGVAYFELLPQDQKVNRDHVKIRKKRPELWRDS